MSYAIDIDPGADTEWLVDQLTTIECGGLLKCGDDNLSHANRARVEGPDELSASS